MRSYLFTDDLTKVLAETYRHMYSPAGLLVEADGGQHEISETTEQAARNLLLQWMRPEVRQKFEQAAKAKNVHPIDVLIPNFKEKYLAVQKKLERDQENQFDRVDMPRIDPPELARFKQALEKGQLDVSAGVNPNAGSTSEFAQQHGPYPKFSSIGMEPTPNSKDMVGNKAAMADWLSAGSAKVAHGDDNPGDDTVNTTPGQVIRVSRLKPIQNQVFLDNSLQRAMQDLVPTIDANAAPIRQNGGAFHPALIKTVDWATGAKLLLSNDYYIIDGHHRFAAAMIIDPNLKIKGFVVDLPWKKLLPLALTYGDARGYVRNKN